MKLLLFSDIPPCTNLTAGIVLNKMCDFLLEEGHDLCCFTIMDPSLHPSIPEDKLSRMHFSNLNKPCENWGGGIKSFYHNNAIAIKELPRMAKKVAKFARDEHCQLIWIVEQGQTMIKMARKVASGAGIPYVVQTWDPTEWWLKENKFDKFTFNSVMKEYGRVLHNAECFIAASWAMEKEYGEQYHCKRSKAVVLGLSENEIKPLGKGKTDEFVIALSGQIYAKIEFAQLIEALNLMHWQYNGKKIIVKLYGTYFNLYYSEEANVIVRGWIEQKKLLPELADADLLYCPYWFSEEYAVVSRNSFPSKLSTYLKLGKPVLFHGPAYSSPSIFLAENDAGYQCNSLDPNDIAKAIKYIMEDPYKHAVCRREIEAFKQKLTNNCMKRDFFEALAIPMKNPIASTESRKSIIENAIQNCNAKIVHVNNVDLLGNRFNGFDMQKTFNRYGGWMKQLVLDKMSDDPNVEFFVSPAARQTVDFFVNQYENDNSLKAMVQPYYERLKSHHFYQEADIAHFHLLHNNVVSFTALPEMARNKRSVLTIHDPWLFTGHCIYPMDCEKWRNGCGNCPDLNRHFKMKNDNTELMWEIKKQIIANSDIDLVVASKWMMKLAQESPITANHRLHFIPFGIDLELFYPVEDNAFLRRKHGISSGNFVILFREDESVYKGMKFIIQALNKIENKKNITVLTVGNTGKMKDLDQTYEVVEKGWVTDDRVISELYACCDVFLMPSSAEAFGLMAIEAMAMKKPVVVFDGTSLPEVTFAPECGIVVPQGDSKRLAKTIEKLINSPEICIARGELGRKLAVEHYDYTQYVLKHIELYKEIMKRSKSKGAKKQ